MAEHPHQAGASSRQAATTNASDLTRFARRVLVAAGADPDEAQVVADVLVWADAVGRPTQGVWRLPILAQRLELGLFRSPCEPDFEPLSEAAVLVDGHNGLGHYVADRAMRRALDLASRSTIGVAGVRNSNYLGPTGFYAQLAAETGMIGIAMSNSFPKVAAHGGREAVLGTNPLAFAAPRADGRSVLLDMSTAASSGSAIRWAAAEGRAAGRAQPDPAPQAAERPRSTDAIEPFGGAKGFGLGLMVEILVAALTGAGLAHEVRSMYQDFENGGDNGHFFLALDIDAWASLATYYERTEALFGAIEASGGEAATGTVRLPGQARWAALARSESDGIEIDGMVGSELDRVADRLGVPVPW